MRGVKILVKGINLKRCTISSLRSTIWTDQTSFRRLPSNVFTLSRCIRKQHFAKLVDTRCTEFPFNVNDVEDLSHMLSVLAEDNDFSDDSVLRTLEQAANMFSNLDSEDKALVGINRECDHIKKCIEKLYLDLSDTNKASIQKVLRSYLDLLAQLAKDVESRKLLVDNNCWRGTYITAQI